MVSGMCVILLVVLDTILEMMCLAHKPVMHESQIVRPGRQQYSAMHVGYGCTTAGRARWASSLCFYSV